MSTRRIVPALLVAMLVFAACGDDDTPSEPSADPADVTGDLFAFGFGYETGDQIAQVRIDEFRDAYPDVDVSFSESGFDNQTFLSALASGEPPDVVNLPRSSIGTYIARGVLEPLDECIEQEEIDMDVYYPAGVGQVTVDGTHYAIPEFFNSRVWMINNTVFEEAGIDPATLDLSDWDAIAAANEQLTQMDGGQLNRIGIDPKLPEFLPLWSNSNGAPMLLDEGRTSNLDDPAVIEALEFSNSLHEPAGGRTTFLDFRDTWDFFGAENQFATGELAAMPMEIWYLNVLAEASPDVDLTVRPFMTREGEPITFADGNSWAISTSTDNAAAACAFIATMTSTETWVAAAEARAETRAEEGLANLGVYTGNREADEVIFTEIVDLSEFPAMAEAVEVIREVQDQAVAFPPSPAAAEFEAAWVAAVNAVMTGEAEAAAELQETDEAIQATIDAAVP